MTSDHKFQVNLHGVITLLSDHLYSGPQVYLRELLQNAVDAITARGHAEPGHAGKIRLEVVHRPMQPPTLVVHDNGVGLTADEVHRFLATIGQSSKRENVHSADFIGQFGIGLLSGFVVCDEIVVITRSIAPESPTVEWRGRGDGTYALRTLDYDFEPGTQVFLRSKPGSEEFFEPDFVRRTVAYFGSLLPIAIEVAAEGTSAAINEDAPWRVRHDSPALEREALLDYGKRIFDQDFFDAIPLVSKIGGVEGVAFVLPHAASIAGKRTHRVYLKNMLLSEHADNLLPEWAFFVKCVVNATELRPTAARESFYEDERLLAARHTLGQCLRNYLVRLSRHDRARLNRLIETHHLAIKALAVDDDEFYRIFIDWLPFETSLGFMSLGEYLQREKIVRYVRTRDQFRQISGVASAQSMAIVNGGYTYDSELIEKLPHVIAGRQIELIDVSEMAQNFEELPACDRDSVFELVKLADRVLQPYRCTAEIKKFHPRELPTLYTANETATFLRSVEQSKEISDELWSGVLDGVAADAYGAGYAQLCLNFNNPLVQRLARLDVLAPMGRKLAAQAIEMLYVQALLLGHYPLKAKEMQLLNKGLLALIELGIPG